VALPLSDCDCVEGFGIVRHKGTLCLGVLWSCALVFVAGGLGCCRSITVFELLYNMQPAPPWVSAAAQLPLMRQW
jgi:hypothetical protein